MLPKEIGALFWDNRLTAVLLTDLREELAEVYWVLRRPVDFWLKYCRCSSRLKTLYTYCRPAALSAVCLSWLGRIWNLGEDGPLCTQQASQHSIFCISTDRCTEYTKLAACIVHNRPPSPKFQISVSISSLGLSTLLCAVICACLYLYEAVYSHVKHAD